MDGPEAHCPATRETYRPAHLLTAHAALLPVTRWDDAERAVGITATRQFGNQTRSVDMISVLTMRRRDAVPAASLLLLQLLLMYHASAASGEFTLAYYTVT